MQDILLNQDGDLLIENGDLKIGFSDNQHQQDIMISEKGEYREKPEIGVGIIQMLSDDEYLQVLIDVKKNLEYDGMFIRNVKFNDNGNLDIDGYYRNS